jgi:8-oxo-dGTP diphosphatase
LIKRNIAVKAIIFRVDGKILLQRRDFTNHIPYPGSWNFFGGYVEGNENLLHALERELNEEIGCVPGIIENEIFQWKSNTESTINHYFPIFFNEKNVNLKLNEGSDFKWVSIEDFVELSLTPSIYENFKEILLFLTNKVISIEQKVENKIIDFYGLIKKNERVYYAKENPFCISRQQMFILKSLVTIKNIPVFRICMHTNDNADIHEMIMIHSKPSKVGPLRQLKTSLSYHIIEGELAIELFDEQGIKLKDYIVSNSNLKDNVTTSIRLNAKQYRTVSSVSPFAIFLEVGSGPFQDSDTIWLKQ